MISLKIIHLITFNKRYDFNKSQHLTSIIVFIQFMSKKNYIYTNIYI